MKKTQRAGTLLFFLFFLCISGKVLGFEQLVKEFKIDQAPEDASSGGSQVGRALNGNHMIAWSDYRSNNYKLYGRVVDGLGNLLGDEFRIDQTTGFENVRFPSVASSDTVFIVVWEDSRNNFMIGGRLFDSLGSPIGDEFRVCPSAGSCEIPDVSAGDSIFLVVWEDTREGGVAPWGRFFADDGTTISADFRIDQRPGPLAPDGRWPDVAMIKNGRSMVSWSDYRNGNFDIYARCYVAVGDSLTVEFRVDQDPGTTDNKYSVVSTFDGGFVVTWSDYRGGDSDVYARIYDAECIPATNEFRVDQAASSTSISGPYSAVDEDGNILFLWEDNRVDSGGDIYARRYDSVGNPLADEFIPQLGPINHDSGGVHAAPAGQNHNMFITWSEKHGAAYDVYGTIWGNPPPDQDGDNMPDYHETSYVCLDGHVADGDDDPDLDSMTNLEEYLYSGQLDPCDPDTDNDGVSDDAEVMGGSDPLNEQIVSGFVKIGSDITISYSSHFDGTPSMVWTGSELGLAWESYYSYNYEIFFKRLSPDGGEIGPNLRISRDSKSSYAPSLAWSGSDYGLIWHDTRSNPYHLFFSRISGTGSILDSEIQVTSGFGHSKEPSMIWGNTEFAVAWHEGVADNNTEIFFSKLNNGGSMKSAEFRVSNAPENSLLASLVWDGNNYAAAWHDIRDQNHEIYFAKVSADGDTVLLERRISREHSLSEEPALVWSGSEYGLAWHDERFGRSEIMFTRIDTYGDTVAPTVRVSEAFGYSGMADLVWNPDLGEYGLAYSDNRDIGADHLDNKEIYFTRLAADGTKKGRDQRVTFATQNGGDVSLVWTGSEYVMAFMDARSSRFKVYISFMGIDGDGDGLATRQESLLGTNPGERDSDFDGLLDGDEAFIYFTDPLAPDSDGDGAIDGSEVSQGTDPLVAGDFIAKVPRLLNYQARLNDSAWSPVTENVEMDFAIHATTDSSTVLWQEGSTVTVTDGIFSVMMGGSTIIPSDLFNREESWLKITIQGEALSPRRQLTSQPISMNALRQANARVESGAETVSLSSQSTISVQIVFARLFNAPPRVAISAANLDAGGELFVIQKVFDVTTTGFKVVLESKSGTPATGDLTFTWLAHGE